MNTYLNQTILTFKRNSITRLGILAVIASVSTIAVAPTTFANGLTGATPAVVQAQMTDVMGTFVAAEAPTTGTVRIVTEGGHRYLEIDSAFSTTDQAPDLHVLLETAEVPPASYSNFGSYINLGKLQTVSGAQRYPIPDSIDIAEFKSVVIWCRMANATIGYASLGGASNAGVR